MRKIVAANPREHTLPKAISLKARYAGVKGVELNASLGTSMVRAK